MTATAGLLTIDAVIIASAQAVCDRAADAVLPAEDDEVTGAMAELAGGLRFYRRIRSGALAPAEAYGQLEERPEWQALPEALLLAAQDAWADAEELAGVIDRHEVAANVSGRDKGESS